MQRLMVLRRASTRTRDMAGLSQTDRPVSVLRVLTVLVILVYGLWGYLSYSDSRTRAALSAELQRRTQERRELAAAVPDLATLDQREATVRAAQEGVASGLFGSTQGVAAVRTVSALAERFGVSVRSLSASEPRPATMGPTRDGAATSTAPKRTTAEQGRSPYESIALSMNVEGARERILQFAEALQSGVLPGMALQRISVDGTAQSQATLVLELYTWPSKPADAPPPSPYSPVGPAATRPAPAVVRVGDAGAALLTWSVKAGNGDWPDALSSVTVALDAPRGSIQSLNLYAETTGDEALDLGRDRLIASAPARTDIPVMLAPKNAFPFQAGQAQRFYLAARISPSAPVNDEMRVAIPPGGVVFASSAWPRVQDAEAFSARLPFRYQAVAYDGAFRTVPGQSVVLSPRVSAPSGQPTLRVVGEPSQGSVSMTEGRMVYTPNAGFAGQDSFTYVAALDGLDSAPATVWVLVWPSATFSPPED